MSYRPGKHIYLAAPFFNDKQRELCEFIEGFDDNRETVIYSPRLDGGVLKPDASIKEREQIFNENLLSIQTAQFVLAVIDDFDPGVIFEMGYAYGKSVSIMAYSDVEGRGLNVMLAQACEMGFIGSDRNKLKAAVKGEIPYVQKGWTGDIQ